MSNVAPLAARQALRQCSRRLSTANGLVRQAPRAVASTVSRGRRTYVSETGSKQATVNIEQTIREDQKNFLSQTGERAKDATMPTTGMGADAMLTSSPPAPSISIDCPTVRSATFPCAFYSPYPSLLPYHPSYPGLYRPILSHLHAMASSTRKRKQDAGEENDFQELPELGSDEEEEE